MIKRWLSKNKVKKLKVIKVLFGIYVAVLLFLLLFSKGSQYSVHSFNLKAFTSITLYFNDWVYSNNSNLWLVNIIGNIIVFIPLGFFLPILFKKYKSFFKTIILVICFSLLVETLQYITHTGVFDIDDIILNSFGGILGYILFAILK